MVPRLPEFAVADAIIELTREQHGTRDDRYLHVIKLRGSHFIDGFHAFRIGRNRLDIFPRLVSPETFGTGYAVANERLTTGVQGLDDMIETGWLRGTSTLLTGPSGVGKTLLGLHFLREGVRQGEPGLLVSFQENPSQLARVCANLSWKADELPNCGGLDAFYTSPVELQIDTIVGEMFRRIEARKTRRVVIDSLGDLMSASREAQRFRDYVYAMMQRFSAQAITAMLTMESQDGRLATEVSPMTDNIVLLEMVLEDTMRRTIRIIKTRGSGYDARRYPLRVVQLHGGTVEAESAGVGKGSEFVVRLPRIAPPDTLPMPAARTSALVHPKRVLIVEDHRDAAESLARLVSLLGHTGYIAHDGPTGFEMIQTSRPDVVLCDIGLPGMRGYELAKKIRQFGPNGARLIALSGYAQPEDVRRAIEAGFDAHIAKPPDPGEIDRLLSQEVSAPPTGSART
jgi:KaiC/GvpD/RAD55 family RecA-like ATPase/ActR/RegA family two-component response regulator